MVDSAILAKKVSVVRDAVARLRSVLPARRERFLEDRTAREVVTLNLFVAIQECLALASHWVADEGWDVPQSHGEVFAVLAAHGILSTEMAAHLGAAAGLRNLIAHQYGVLDWARVFTIASSEVDDLVSFCEVLARRSDEGAPR